MGDGTKIEWTDATVNAVNGCSVVSPGCTNCYAMRLAGTRLRNHPSRAGLTIDTKAGPVWTGEVRLNEKALMEPLRWRRPRKIFWNAHGDLFHDNVPDEWIDRQFAVMMMTPQHIHQVLTKRPDRMRAYLSQFEQVGRYVVSRTRSQIGNDPRDGNRFLLLRDGQSWPLPNVWLGTSVEDQARVSRLDDLGATPAAVRFVSAEPLLGKTFLTASDAWFSGRIHWVICGGESGAGARPMHPDWARSLRDQCAAAEVPFFMKQWGAWWPLDQTVREWNISIDEARAYFLGKTTDSHALIGKSKAGRLLDGVEHNGMPV